MALFAEPSVRSIAAKRERSSSSVCRKINRKGGRQGYRANEAVQAAWERAHRPKRCKLVHNQQLTRIVVTKLKRLWAPVKIAGWLKQSYPTGENYQLSHEMLYRSLYIKARVALKKEVGFSCRCVLCSA